MNIQIKKTMKADIKTEGSIVAKERIPFRSHVFNTRTISA